MAKKVTILLQKLFNDDDPALAYATEGWDSGGWAMPLALVEPVGETPLDAALRACEELQRSLAERDKQLDKLDADLKYLQSKLESAWRAQHGTD